MDADTVHGVHIIGAPNLRTVIQHTRIKSSASGSTILDNQVREHLKQPLLNFINSQYMPVPYFPLTVRWKKRRTCFRQHPVHIPLDVSSRSFTDSKCNRIGQIIAHLRICKIQNPLISALGRNPAFLMQYPVRMCPEKLRFFRYHFRLEPKSQSNPQGSEF